MISLRRRAGDNVTESNLINKISPLLEGQVPDFIQADHPVFVKFLKSYFEYLEAQKIYAKIYVRLTDL